jgi:hypothetical protein
MMAVSGSSVSPENGMIKVMDISVVLDTAVAVMKG